MVLQADTTLAAIRKKVRRLTLSSSESSLTTDDLDQYINTFYNNDFPAAIKLDTMRSVYTFYTRPNIDRYPLDVNYNMGIREPVYVEGIAGYLFKDRQQFYSMWPRFPTKSNPVNGNGSQQIFNFTISSTPFLSKEFVLGGVDINGVAISINDDGNGNLYTQTPNPVVSVPAYNVTPPVPGMKNVNTLNPGLENVIYCGTVDYVTGAVALDLTLANQIPAAGSQMTCWVAQYQTGRPYSLLFWNNEFTIRPVPSLIHKVEVETYLTPVQFMNVTDHPIINQWWEYIACGSAIKILEDRGDIQGVQNLQELFDRQEALVLERQAVEEINQRNTTIFSSTVMQNQWNTGGNIGWY